MIVVVFATVVHAAVYVYFRAVAVTAAIDIPDVPIAADVAADGFGVAVVVVLAVFVVALALAVAAVVDVVVADDDLETLGLVVCYRLLLYY